MPYEGEQSNMLGHIRFVFDEGVRTRLQSLETAGADRDEIRKDLVVESAADFLDGSEPPETIVAIDGSRAEVQVGNPRHDAHVGFVEVSAVEVDAALLRRERGKAMVRTGIEAEAASAQHVRFIVPSKNVHTEEGLTTEQAWRKFTFDALQSRGIYDTKLFDSYLAFMRQQGILSDTGIKLFNCPNSECGYGPQHIDPESTDSCEGCGATIYPTDRLRIYENVNNKQSNVAALNVLMGVVEHLTLHAAIENSKEEAIDQGTTDMSGTGFIKDGPLAQFDTASWVGRGFRKYLHEIRQACDPAELPVVIGLHKDGGFPVFAEQLRQPNPSDPYPDEQFLVPMSSDFIYEYVVPQPPSDDDYGMKNYYGKNFVFRSSDRHVFALSIPRRRDADGNLLWESDDYPELGRALATLNDVRLYLYQDGIIPIQMAHAEATIPENVGGKVLYELAEMEMFGASRLASR